MTLLAMNNQITTLIDTTSNKPSTAGLILRRAPKSGSQSIMLQKKKDFRESLIQQKNPTTGANYTAAEANRAFEEYRIKTVKEFTSALAQKMLTGDLQVERVSADAVGGLTTARFVRPVRTAQDKAEQALADASRLTGLPIEQLRAAAKAKQQAEAQTLDVQAQSAGNGAPQHVATAA